jgi:integrase
VSPVAANRLVSLIKRVFRWAASEDYIDADPAAAIDKPASEAPRARYLSEDEIRVVWLAADKIGDPMGRLVKLCLLTGQRRGEVAGLRRSELGKLRYKTKGATTEGDAWLLPAERTKRRVPHTVPLSPLALQLINDAPVLEDADDNPFDHVLASGARGDQPVSGWSKYRRALDKAVGEVIAKDAGQKYDPDKHAIPSWHLHDLRATCATHMERELEVPTRVVSRILNHAEGDGRSTTARYLRHTWDAEAADALNRWAAAIARIVGLNIVKLGEVKS